MTSYMFNENSQLKILFEVPLATMKAISFYFNHSRLFVSFLNLLIYAICDFDYAVEMGYDNE